MHLHGHNFWVLSEGPGDWDGTIINKQNPQRRYVQILQPGYFEFPTSKTPSHLVIEYNADNPGVWPLVSKSIPPELEAAQWAFSRVALASCTYAFPSFKSSYLVLLDGIQALTSF